MKVTAALFLSTHVQKFIIRGKYSWSVVQSLCRQGNARRL